MRRLLFFVVALSLAGALPGVQGCCYQTAKVFQGDGYDARVAFERDLHFDRVPEVLAPFESSRYRACRKALGETTQSVYYLDTNYAPTTFEGYCNIFGCNCEHCYADSDCTGTADNDPKKQYERWFITALLRHEGTYNYNPEAEGTGLNCAALSNFTVPGYTGSCVTPSGSAASATTAITEAQRACADLDTVMNTPLPQLTARLSSLYCANAGDSVGLEFTASVLATLDADKSGSLDCAEWGIAKQATPLEQLPGGGYFGPAKLEAPLCKLSAEGKEKIASYNAHLAKLTLGTLATKATALAASAASRAAVTVENDVVAGSAAGAVLAVRDKVAGANATSISG